MVIVEDRSNSLFLMYIPTKPCFLYAYDIVFILGIQIILFCVGFLQKHYNILIIYIFVFSIFFLSKGANLGSFIVQFIR